MYEPGSHRPLALVEGNAKKNQKTRTFWYQNDHLGTPHSLTDSLGGLVYSCTYNAYGQIQTETQHQQEERGLRVETNLRFQGQYADEETGLFYNLNRYYDPGLGRYLTADPIKLAGGLNQYRYCTNPINWIDPLGLKNLPGGKQQGSVQQADNGLPNVNEGQPELVNIDTGTANAFISENSPIRHELKENVKNKQMVMTETAANEFENITSKIAGPLEKMRSDKFMQRVIIIPDDPSIRAINLKITKKVGENDKIIFGTGDKLGVPTMTSDAKFVRGASSQGVDFDALIHNPVPLKGQ